MPDNTIQLVIKLTAGDAAQIVDQLTTKVHNLGGSVKLANANLVTFDDLATKIGFRLQGISNILNALRSTYGAWIQESNTAEAAAAKLEQALKNQGIYSEALINDIKAYAAARQEATGIDDDATIAIAGQLVAMGLQGQALKDAINATQDLATLMDGDLQSAVRVVADAFNGNTGMLGRYIKNLDEADIKNRGMVSIIEQLQRAVGGQAVAFGSTAAGAMRKYEASVADLKQSFGDLIKQGIDPFLAVIKYGVDKLNSVPQTIKVIALSVTSLSIAFMFLNNQFGYIPYIITGSIGAIATLISALNSGNPIITTATLALGALVATMVAFNAQSLIASSTLATRLIPTIEAVIVEGEGLMIAIGKATIAFTTMQLATLGIFAALAALVGVAIAYKSRQEEINRKLDEQRVAGYRLAIGLDDLAERVKKMTQAQLDWEKANAQLSIKKIEQEIRSLGLVMTTEAAEEKRKLEEKKKAWQEYYDTLIGEQKRRAEESKKLAEDTSEASVMVRKRQAEVELSGLQQKRKLIDIEYQEEMNRIKRLANEHQINERQRTELERLAKLDRSKKLRQIDAETQALDEKLKNEALIKNIERAQEQLTVELENEEKLKLATAQTEQEKDRIRAEYSRRRIELERDTAIAIADLNRSILKAQLAAVDPSKRKELQAQIDEYTRQIDAIRKLADEKLKGVEADETAASLARERQRNEENVAYLEEKERNERRLRDKKKMNETLSELDTQYVKAKQRHSEIERQYLQSTDEMERKRLKSMLDRTQEELDAIEAKREVIRQSTEEQISAGMQAYSAQKSLSENIRSAVGRNIRAYIAEAVMSYVKDIVASTGPLALILAPAMGVALQSALEALIPSYGTGGRIYGRRHSEGGTLIEAEEGEYIVRRDVALRHLPFLERLNAGLVTPRYQSGGIVGSTVITQSDVELKKELRALRQELRRIQPQVNIFAETDINRYNKLEKKLQRTRLAYAL